MQTLKINLAAVLTLAVAHQITNFLWYSLAGQDWMTLSGLTLEQIEANQSFVPYVVSLVAAGLACWFMAWLFAQLRVETAARGIILAVAIYGCFLFFQVAAKDMFHLHPFRLTMLNEGINFLNFALSGAVLAVWKKYETASE